MEDRKLYQSIIESYDFKTEEIHLDLMAAVNNLHKVNDDKVKEGLGKSHIRRAIPAKVDYDRVSPYLLYRSKEVIKKTMENTTQLAKAVINSPMRRHLKSRFHMLRHKKA